MSHVAESISRLVELARRLRTAAGELGQLDLKSQIVDEITTLQEIRDELLGDRSGDEYDRVAPTSREADPASSSERMVSLSDAGIGIFQPTGNDETYSLTPEGEAPPETSSNDAVASPLAPPKTAPSAGDLRAMIEMRIADLDQLEQAATRRMNDVPTAEQKQIKAKAQHAGREAGKAGKELQQYIYSAMKLSSEQRSKIQAARKDVQSLREAIEKERVSLKLIDSVES
jgi:hypothetical protein